MLLELVPPERVGPIMIGMDFDAAQTALSNLPGFRTPTLGRRVAPGFAHYESEMSIALYQERERVKAIEIFRPEEEDTVLYRGISIFETPADQVVEDLSALVRLDVEREGLLS